jgi:hypothetical protein
MVAIPQDAFLLRKMAFALAAVVFVGGEVCTAKGKDAATPPGLTNALTRSCYPQSDRVRRHRGRPTARSLRPCAGSDR